MKKAIWGAGACVAALALVLGSASAQQAKAPEAPKTTTPAAKTPAKKPATTTNPCTALKEEAACTANTECGWTKETVTKKGQKRSAYCHKKPAAAKKAAAPAAAKAATPATPPAPKAPAAEKKQ